MKVVVTGATGFIGKPLCAALVTAGHAVTALSRHTDRAQAALGPKVCCLAWGVSSGERAWKQAIAEAEAVLHLAGESVVGERWSPEFKARIRSSRVETTHALVEAICQGERRPAVLVSASAVGYYGDRKEALVDEQTPPAHDFLGEVCVAWEAEAEKAQSCGVRVARMRIGIVLGPGGALEKMLYPLPLPISPWKWGLAGPMGSGRQWMPWIHIDDVVGLFVWAMTNPAVRGPVNTVAPNPVSNAEFARALGRALHRPAAVPFPGIALRVLVGEFAETLLGGQRALPTVAQSLGYRFRFPDLDAVLNSLLRK